VFWRERFEGGSRNGSSIELVISVFCGCQEEDVFGVVQPADLRDDRPRFKGSHLRQLDRLYRYFLIFIPQELLNLTTLTNQDGIFKDLTIDQPPLRHDGSQPAVWRRQYRQAPARKSHHFDIVSNRK